MDMDDPAASDIDSEDAIDCMVEKVLEVYPCAELFQPPESFDKAQLSQDDLIDFTYNLGKYRGHYEADRGFVHRLDGDEDLFNLMKDLKQPQTQRNLEEYQVEKYISGAIETIDQMYVNRYELLLTLFSVVKMAYPCTNIIDAKIMLRDFLRDVDSVLDMIPNVGMLEETKKLFENVKAKVIEFATTMKMSEKPNSTLDTYNFLDISRSG